MQITCRAPVKAVQRPDSRSRTRVVVSASAETTPLVTRRSALQGLVLAPALLMATPTLAFAKDARQAIQDKEARRAKLKASAAKMKASQKTEAAFADSNYSLPEDATTPNMRGGATKPPQQAEF